MQLRVRGPEGQATLTVEDACSVAAFRALLAEKTGVPAERQEVRGGFPPKLLEFPADGTLASLGIQSGDTLTVTASAAPVAAAPAAAAPAAAAAAHDAAAVHHAGVAHLTEDEQLARAIALSLGQAVPDLPASAPAAAPAPAAAALSTAAAAAAAQRRAASPTRAHPTNGSGAHAGPLPAGAPTSVPLPDGTAVVRRIIDSDNSCLFNAVGYVTERSRKKAPQLRQVIADAVLADPFEWNEAVLGKEPAEYCRWIRDSSKWGGAIELSILSRHLGKEIAAFDIQTKRVDIYGQGSGYAERVMLIYDGLHYDALAVAAFEGAPEQLDVTVLPASGPRCDAIGLRGEKEAVEHAKATGHSNFSEY